MLIIGAKGFAKEVLEIFAQSNQLEGICFYDGLLTEKTLLYDKFPILVNDSQLKEQLLVNPNFVLGIGSPQLRRKLAEKIINLGGILNSIISNKTTIGHFGNKIGQGCNIMSGTVITNDITIGDGVLINLCCTIGHDSFIGDYVELCPGVNVSGNVKIGNNVFVGTNAVIAPGCSIGDNSIIGAGSVILKSIPENSFFAGNPAKLIRMLNEV